jgi:hypothetical protein
VVFFLFLAWTPGAQAWASWAISLNSTTFSGGRLALQPVEGVGAGGPSNGLDGSIVTISMNMRLSGSCLAPPGEGLGSCPLESGTNPYRLAHGRSSEIETAALGRGYAPRGVAQPPQLDPRRGYRVGARLRLSLGTMQLGGITNGSKERASGSTTSNRRTGCTSSPALTLTLAMMPWPLPASASPRSTITGCRSSGGKARPGSPADTLSVVLAASKKVASMS